MATFLQIYNQCAQDLDLDEVTAAELDAAATDEIVRLKNHINRAYTLVWNRLNANNEDAEVKTTLSIVADTSEYAMPSGIKHVQMIKIDLDDPPLKQVPWTEFETLYTPTLLVDTGLPGRYSIYQRKIKFWPTPSEADTATIWGLAGVTALSDDADEPDLDADLHDVIVEWALYYAMRYENNPAVMFQKEDAKERLKEARHKMRVHHSVPNRMTSEDEMNRGDYWLRFR